jgi:predicted protein tyrosine phosphatase
MGNKSRATTLGRVGMSIRNVVGVHRIPHILFVCGRNQWRGPTAVQIYKNDNRIDVRSAGMSEKSRHALSAEDITWADLILVMENRYKTRILEKFHKLSLPEIANLDIPDEYPYMDAELIESIQKGVEFYIGRIENRTPRA